MRTICKTIWEICRQKQTQFKALIQQWLTSLNSETGKTADDYHHELLEASLVQPY